MADETVQVKDLVAIVKILFSQMVDLHVSIMTLRKALVQAKSLPIPEKDLSNLRNYFDKEYPPVQKARSSIDRIDSSSLSAIDKLLRDFQGTIQ
jgi:hypothetical protein